MSRIAIVNGEFPEIKTALGVYADSVLSVNSNPYLPEPIAAHVDMNCFLMGKRLFVVGGTSIMGELSEVGCELIELPIPGKEYPQDVICNAKFVGEHLFCNVRTLSKEILACAENFNYKIISVRQGYTGCSICKVTDNAMITSDIGIAKAAKENDLDVLVIDNKYIKLPGYDVGFIGGCTGLLNKNELLFTGSLDKCSFGKAMKEFCEKHGVSVIELTDDRPVDIGGILILEVPEKGF